MSALLLLWTMGCRVEPVDTANVRTEPVCDVDHRPLAFDLCLSSTDVAVQDLYTTGSEWPPWERSVEVVAPPVNTTVPRVGWFAACDGSDIPVTQLVELVDESGEHWVVGFAIGEGEDPASVLDTLEPGAQLTLVANQRVDSFSQSNGVALHDQTGPLAVWDIGAALDETMTGGIRRDEVGHCVYDDGADRFWRSKIELSTDHGQVQLYQGESADLDVGGRTVDAAVAHASWVESCTDGCGWTGWAVWAQMP